MISKQELEKMRSEFLKMLPERDQHDYTYKNGAVNGFDACQSILLPLLEKTKEEVFQECMNALTDAGCFLGAAVVKAKRAEILAGK